MSDYDFRVLKKSEVLARKAEGKPWFDADRLLANLKARRTEKTAMSVEERDAIEEAERHEHEEEKSAFWRGFQRRSGNAF